MGFPWTVPTTTSQLRSAAAYTPGGILRPVERSLKADLDQRLARIEGQVRGLRRLIAEDAYCCDILTQISAVTSVLHQTAAKLASAHIRHCVAGTSKAHPQACQMTTEELHAELDQVLRRLMKG